MTNTTLAHIATDLLEHDNFVLCGHVSPDGDCLGSEFALAEALEALGKNVVCLLANSDPVDYALSQLPFMSKAVVAKDYVGEAYTFVSVDVPNTDRLGNDAAALHARARHTIAIDHHPSLAPMAKVNYVDETAAACSMIVWDLLAEMGVQRTAQMAAYCYIGLMTDTGRFQYQNTNAIALHAASSMVEAGANPSSLASLVYQNRSFASLALEERMISRVEMYQDSGLAMSFVTIDDFAQTGAKRADAEPLIDVLRCLRDIRVACLLREQDGTVRGSLRAKDDTDVALIARQLGGGGHKAAAGFTFQGSIDQARSEVISQFAALELPGSLNG